MSVNSKMSHHKNGALLRDVSGVVLVGGKSRRFGKNKALVKIGGVPLIERVTRVLTSIFEETVLITNTPDLYAYLNLAMREDLIKDLGPIGGIYTALSSLRHEAAFLVACDMPFLNPALICHMVECRPGFDLVVPRIGWKLEALHALYTKGCLPAIKHLIRSRRYQVISFFHEVSARYVDEAEIRLFDPDLRSFYNINRPQEEKAFRPPESEQTP